MLGRALEYRWMVSKEELILLLKDKESGVLGTSSRIFFSSQYEIF